MRVATFWPSPVQLGNAGARGARALAAEVGSHRQPGAVQVAPHNLTLARDGWAAQALFTCSPARCHSESESVLVGLERRPALGLRAHWETPREVM